MRAHRLVKQRYARDPLSCAGARLSGGRWNPPQVPLLYCSATLALAALETFVHLQPDARHVHHVAIAIEIPDAAPVDTWATAELPASWRKRANDPTCQTMGKAWIDAGTALALRVPSVLVPSEYNLLVNPAHPAFSSATVLSRESFAFDPRMWKSPVKSAKRSA